jgi:Lysylphosphatidylglycerol synthase TM region
VKLRPALRVLARPTLVPPVLLAAALLAFAFKLGGLPGVLRRIQGLPTGVLWLTLGLGAGYLALKAMQLRLLLDNLGLRVPWADFALAFCVGELTLTLPFGLFAQNWVMSASSQIHAARSVAATVMMLLAEIIVALGVLAAIGIPGWTAVRPAAVGVLIACASVVFGLLRYEHVTSRVANKVRQPWLRKGLLAGIELLASLKRLSRPKLVGINVLLAAGYLAALAYALLVVGRGAGVPALDYTRAVTIYAFALVVVLLGGGAFGQVGTVDVLGMVAGRAWGIDYSDGLALMLGFRVAWTGAMWLLNLPVVFLLWHLIPRPRRASRSSAEQRQKTLD